MPFYGSSVATEADKGLVERDSAACTNACTSKAKKPNAIDVDALAAELLALPKEELARLLTTLLSKGESGDDDGPV